MSTQKETQCKPEYNQAVMGERTCRKEEAARQGVGSILTS
jgi:hypothetical protein